MANKRIRLTSIYIVRVAVMAALLTTVKFALSFIPNIEAVTLLVMVFSASFGMLYSLPAAIVFCITEMLIYGFHSWVILYFIYWPLLAVVSARLLKKKNLIAAVLIAAVFSFLFGVLSACTDTLFCVMKLSSQDLLRYFTAYYLRGLYFDVIHIVSVSVSVLVLFRPLSAVCRRIMPRQYAAAFILGGKPDYDEFEYTREK